MEGGCVRQGRPNVLKQVRGGAAAAGIVSPPVPVLRSGGTRTCAGVLNWLLEGGGWTPLLAVCDGLASSLGVLLALRGIDVARFPVRDLPLLAIGPLDLAICYLRGLYQTRLRPLLFDWLAQTIGATALTGMAVLAGAYLLLHRVPGELRWLQAWAFSTLLILCGRLVLAGTQRFARRRGLIGRPVLILGAGIVGTQLARRLELHPEYGLRPIGLIDDEPPALPDHPEASCAVPLIGRVAELEELVRRTDVRHLVVAFSSVADQRLSPLIQRCQELGIEVSVVPRMFDWLNNRITYEAVGGMPLLTCRVVSPSSRQFALKYALDRLLAAALLLLLSPLLAVVAVAIKLSSPGPVLYRQRRVGHDAKEFDLLKFRSMRDDGPRGQFAPSSLLRRGVAPGGVEGADRRTAVGKIIRRTGIDELPQLINVLKGEMSLIGPRPERPEFVKLFKEEVNRYADRLRVKSGITGLAQVYGLRGQTSLWERVELDNFYISHWSFGLDLKILLMTLATPFQAVE